MSEFERLQYEFPEIWQDEWFPQEDRDRVATLAKLIPADSATVLDVGCGNGLFLNHLREHYVNRFTRLVGIDRSEAALAHVKTEKKRIMGIENIPFADQEFDTVTTMEVFEHLPHDVYQRAVAEVARVARETVIVSVPYAQDLRVGQGECPLCFTRFDPDYHVRSYDEETMRSLLGPEFEIAGLFYLGESVCHYDREFRDWARARVRALFHETPSTFPSYAICPMCGFFDSTKLAMELESRKRARAVGEPPRKVSKLSVRTFIRGLLPKRSKYRWIAATYVRILGINSTT